MIENLGEGPFTILFDRVEMKPGCAILQALGGSPSIASAFPSETWLVYPTPNMRLYEVTKEQLAKLVQMVEDRHIKKAPGR
jgi:hypothetical protein